MLINCEIEFQLVEETPNKFKSLYRPPQHVRSPHRVRRKSIGGTKHKVEINNGINSSNDNKLSPKSKCISII